MTAKLNSTSFKRRSVDVAIWLLAGVSFLTTTAGILSVAPTEAADSILWKLLALLLAGGLSIGIGSLAMMLFERVTVPRLVTSLILAAIATLFDASFYQRHYAELVSDTTRERIDLETRRREYDRLTREAATVVSSVKGRLAKQRLDALQREREARESARWEEKLRPEEELRVCGSRCKEHLRDAARFQAEVEDAEQLEAMLAKFANAPATDSWDDLDRFHTAFAGVLREVATGATLPEAPVRPALTTAGGNATGIGGLGIIMENLLAGQFSDVKFALPVLLAAISEFTVIILVLGTRPWRPFRVWLREKLENVEEMADQMPALLPLALLIVRHGVFTDHPEMRARRGERNRRRHQHDMLEEEFVNLGEQITLRVRAKETWRNDGAASANGNGHDTSAGTSPT